MTGTRSVATALFWPASVVSVAFAQATRNPPLRRRSPRSPLLRRRRPRKPALPSRRRNPPQRLRGCRRSRSARLARPVRGLGRRCRLARRQQGLLRACQAEDHEDRAGRPQARSVLTLRLDPPGRQHARTRCRSSSAIRSRPARMPDRRGCACQFAMYDAERRRLDQDVAEENARMVDAMRKGADLTVKGPSGRGTAWTDQYSLRGSRRRLKNRAGVRVGLGVRCTSTVDGQTPARVAPTTAVSVAFADCASVAVQL